MKEIVFEEAISSDPVIYVGDLDIYDEEPLDKIQTWSVLNLSGSPNISSDSGPSYSHVVGANYAHIPIADRGTNDDHMLRLAVDTAKRMLESDRKRFLIHCAAGMSRSPSILAKAWSEHVREPLAPDEALDEIREHKEISVNPSLWEDIKDV